MTGRGAEVAMLLVRCVRRMYEPSPPLFALNAHTGALRMQAVVGPRTRVEARATAMRWAEVVETGNATVARLRRQLAERSADRQIPPDLRDELAAWVDCCRPPSWGDVPVDLQEEGRHADDPRLASLPFPAHAVPVRSDAMAPLPAPPDQRRVPEGAREWRHALRPHFFAASLRFLCQMRARLSFAAANGTFRGAPTVDFVAFGPDAWLDWARQIIEGGEYLIRRGGKLQILDCSRSPPTHCNREYLAAVLTSSEERLRAEGCSVDSWGLISCRSPPHHNDERSPPFVCRWATDGAF